MRRNLSKSISMGVISALLLTMLTPTALIVNAATTSIVLEAENGILTGTQKATTPQGFSGTGYVTGFDAADYTDAVTVTTNGIAAGLYNLTVQYKSPNGDKACNLFVNGAAAGALQFTTSTAFTTVSAGKVLLNAGTNTIKIVQGWGWYDIDSFTLTPVSDAPIQHNVNATLVNPNATKEAKTLINYLSSMYGKKILSGQHNPDLAKISSQIGKLPAIVGYDFIDYSPTRASHGLVSTSTEDSIAWAKKGGIVTIQWHWNAPTKLIDTPGKEWWRAFYTDSTTFDIAYAMNNLDSEDYKLLVSDIDVIAVQLKKLQAAGVPILWRPLHEASGGWFWWGAKGPEACVKLYKLMYDRLTNYHKINNLIWIWNSTEPAWYPGDEYVDIVSGDSYPTNGDYSPQTTSYEALKTLVNDKKIVAMSENGPLPDPKLLPLYHADWSWFCTWGSKPDETLAGLWGNTFEHEKEVYNSDYVITLDELPNFNAPTTEIIGDVNADGVVNLSDYSLIKSYILGKTTDFPAADDLLTGDVNGDGKINIADIILVKNFIFGRITVFPKK